MEHKAPQIQNSDSFKVMGISRKIIPNNGKEMDDFKAHWDKFYQSNISEKIPNKSSSDIYAIYYNYDSDQFGEYDFLIGMKVEFDSEVPEGMEVVTLLPSKYSVYEVKGEFPKSLIGTWGRIWENEKHRTFKYDFELYKPTFDPSNIEKSTFEIYIGTE